jgi:tetratricopeptide (TPR) repeat protein
MKACLQRPEQAIEEHLSLAGARAKKTRPRLTAVWVAAVLVLSGAAGLPAAPVSAYRGKIELPTYPWTAVRHPYFRGTDKVNIYPYPMLDFLSREKTNHTYRTVVLQNEYLRVTFLPELGGKIHEVTDNVTGLPMFYVNHVIKPGLIGQCGAWTSGGVEWNTGPQGHTVGCMQPVAVEILPPETDGSRSVAIGETERIYGTRWTVVVTLRPGCSFLEERIRICNPTETVRPYYFWNCTAMPNTPGFRFIYPMTLGTDHGSEKFFDWPIDHGKDLSRGTNYHDASSIFAWHCDQDFFGSYDDAAERGVVSYANHHQVPGKKAWTWGQGGFGKMHQMDLTDADGPYNEVQTGPLLTQGEVGRLDPGETVEWKEWWYPVHGLGGFTYANREVAANASVEGRNLRLRLLGTGVWSPVDLRVLQGTTVVARAQCRLSPEKTAELKFAVDGASEAFWVELRGGQRWVTQFDQDGVATLVVAEERPGNPLLARFRVPLDLPQRSRPEPKPKAEAASDFAEAGWQHFLFARSTEAGDSFRKALEKDPKSVSARTGVAFLQLEADPEAAIREARAALATRPEHGPARFALAVAESRAGQEAAAREDAWEALLDPATALPARALLARLLLRQNASEQAASVLDESGPWQADPACRGLKSLALLLQADASGARSGLQEATRLARENLAADPLDAFARSLLWLAGAEDRSLSLRDLLDNQPQPILDLAAQYLEAGQERFALRVIDEFFPRREKTIARDPLPLYWGAWLAARAGQARSAEERLTAARALPANEVFPYRRESVPVLRWALETNPADGKAALYLGHVLFQEGRHAEGRQMWTKAAALGAEPVLAQRALGMACLTLDNDPDAALKHLARAHELDRGDAVVARDLARVLFTLADKAGSAERTKELVAQARDTLKEAFPSGRGRSDFVALLAKAQNRSGEYAETAQMLDSVRVTVWEGAHEVHDLFEEAHVGLGEAHLKAGRAAQALAEFNRALEYPENLATGRLENAREAPLHYLRGNACLALGQKDKAIEAWKKAADEPASKDKRQEEARKNSREALEKNR